MSLVSSAAMLLTDNLVLVFHGELFKLYMKTNPWWRHQMETISALLTLCAGNSPGTGKFPAQGPVTRSFDIFFDLCPNKRLSKQPWAWWFQTPSHPLWRHCHDNVYVTNQPSVSDWVVQVPLWPGGLDVWIWNRQPGIDPRTVRYITLFCVCVCWN